MANLIPPLKFAASDSTGAPLASGKLYTYEAGTSTPKATYTDSGLGTPNANPVVLNSRGEADVWLSGGYKFVLKDSADVTIYTVDNVTDALANITVSGTLSISSTAVTWSGNPTHSGNHTFSGNVTVQGNTTLGNAGTDAVTTNGNVTMNAPTSGVHSVSGTLSVGTDNTYNLGESTKRWVVVYAKTFSDGASGILASSSGTDSRFGSGSDWLTSSWWSNGVTRVTLSSTGATTIAPPSSGSVATLTLGALNGAAPLKLGALTVANLPAAATAGAGAKGFVTDANATTFASVVAAGGANGVPVYCDGTNWRIG